MLGPESVPKMKRMVMATSEATDKGYGLTEEGQTVDRADDETKSAAFATQPDGQLDDASPPKPAYCAQATL